MPLIKNYILILECMSWHSQNYKIETKFRMLRETYLGDNIVFILDTENQLLSCYSLRSIII